MGKQSKGPSKRQHLLSTVTRERVKGHLEAGYSVSATSKALSIGYKHVRLIAKQEGYL